jgi:hypothetical protein
LHQAINEIRDAKTQIKSLHTRFDGDERVKPVLAAADDMDKKMSDIEAKLIQVNSKSSEGTLAFPSMLNEEFDTFSHVIEGSDRAPTQPQLEVFGELSKRLDEQLQKWGQIKADDLAKLNASIKQTDVPAVLIKAKPEENKP